MLGNWFSSASYMPHGYCLLWKPWLVSLHAFSDFFIFAAYAAIPVAIWLFVRRRPDFAMKEVAWLFVAFILLCGATHLVGLATLWLPLYEVQGMLKLVTAGVSVMTALLIFPLIPKAVALPTPAELTEVNRRLEMELAAHRGTLQQLEAARAALESSYALKSAELDRTAALLGAISHATEALLYAKDGDGRMVFANPALLAILGLPAGQVVGKTEMEFLSDRAQAKAIQATDRDVMSRSEPLTVEEPVTTADGRSIVYLSTKVAHRGASGELLGLVGVSIDITAQKKQAAEALEISERLRARNEELETLLDVIPAAVFIASDPRGEQMVGNRYCHELLRVPAGRSVARSAPAGVRPEHFDVVSNGRAVARDDLPVRRAAVTGEPVNNVEMELAFADGDRRTIFGSAAPLFAGDGSVRGSVGAFVDITERKLAEQRATAVSREISHRLANLLGLVQAMARISLRSDGPEEARLHAFEQRMIGLGQAMRLMTEREWDRVPLTELASRCLDLFGFGARLSIGGPPVEITAGLAQCLSMAFHELATNAVKYGALGDSHGLVALRWHQDEDGDRLTLTWTESGGRPVVAPSRAGFGRFVIRDMLVEQCGAVVTLDYPVDGMRWTAVVPLGANR